MAENEEETRYDMEISIVVRERPSKSKGANVPTEDYWNFSSKYSGTLKQQVTGVQLRAAEMGVQLVKDGIESDQQKEKKKKERG